MPHISVKLWPGKSEEEKAALTEKMTEAMMEIMGIPEKSISVVFEEIPKERWTQEVYEPEIIGKENLLYKRPGY